MSVVFILLGSNIGNSHLNLQKAINAIQGAGANIIEVSSIYKTKAWGNTNQDDFLNAVLKLNTNKTPTELLKTLLNIEQEMGRVRGLQPWLPRIIDIDILYYNQDIIQIPELKIPHPFIAERKFTLVPLAEIAPYEVHPQLKFSNQEMLNNCNDKSEVTITTLKLIFNTSTPV